MSCQAEGLQEGSTVHEEEGGWVLPRVHQVSSEGHLHSVYARIGAQLRHATVLCHPGSHHDKAIYTSNLTGTTPEATLRVSLYHAFGKGLLHQLAEVCCQSMRDRTRR